MWKVAKYKIYSLLQSKGFRIILLIVLVIFNSRLLKCGAMEPLNEYFTEKERYRLLMGNYLNIMQTLGTIMSIFIGVSIIDNDIKSGKMSIMIIFFKKRWKYMLGNIIGIVMVTCIYICIVTVNLLIYFKMLNVTIYCSSIIEVSIGILANMVIVILVSALISFICGKKFSVLANILGMVLFYMYTYQYIPVVEKMVYIKMVWRRVLAMFFPIVHVYDKFVYSYEFESPSIIKPYIFNSLSVYQLVYIAFIIIMLAWCFEKKEI